MCGRSWPRLRQKELQIYSFEIVLLKDKMMLHVGKGHECDVVEGGGH
jgi:hypothetical protein